jgi:tetratricopeptide (TPR) repeat protein
MDDTRHALARDAIQQGQFTEAEELVAAIISDNPDDSEAHYLLAVMQLECGKFSIAHASIKIAIDKEPKNARFRVALGQIFTQQKQYSEAESAFETVLLIDPGNGDAYTNLGAMQFNLARYEEAKFNFQKALFYHPTHGPAAIQLGRALLRLYKVEEAVSLFHAILLVSPDNTSAQINIGIGYTLLGDLESAQEAFETALISDPDNAEAHVSYAHLLLLRGDYERGYAEHEWRLKKTDYRDLSAFRSPLWSGEDLAEKSILLWGEQGLGDTLQFIRYAPHVAQSAQRVIVECNPILHQLIANMPGIDKVVDLDGGRNYDFHLPLMSLPLWYGVSKIPDKTPYLSAPKPADLDRKEKLRVGLIWAGNPNHARDRERSRLLSEFAPLTARADVTFYALQKGIAAKQSPPDGMCLIDLGSGFADMADTAAAMRSLDLVISVDSAPAHLAGALGIPVWVLLTRMPDWRWGLGRDDTPWYPSMRLFRDENGWEDVFERVAAALTNFKTA